MSKPPVVRHEEDFEIIVSAHRRYVTGLDWHGKLIVDARFWYDRAGREHAWLLLGDGSIELLDEKGKEQ